MAGYLVIARLKPFDADADVDVETLPGQAVFACLPREHSTTIPSQRIPLPLPTPHHSHLPQTLSLFIPGRGPGRFTKLCLLSSHLLHVSARVERATAQRQGSR